MAFRINGVATSVHFYSDMLNLDHLRQICYSLISQIGDFDYLKDTERLVTWLLHLGQGLYTYSRQYIWIWKSHRAI